MNRLSAPLRLAVTSTALVSGTLLITAAVNAAATVWLMTFTIDDGPSYAVSGDGIDPAEPGGPGVYKDYRLGTGLPDDLNYCVEASPTPLLFIRMNRKLDGPSGNQYCDLFGGSPRQFSITISNGSACSELWTHGYVDAPETPCVLAGVDKLRIRIDSDLYAKRTTTTPVAFLAKPHDTAATSYEIRTAAGAAVLQAGVDPSMRIVSYSGSARLWRFEPGEKARAVAESFPLPFQMTFRRSAQ